MQTPHTSAFVDDIRALPRAFWSLQLGLVLSNLTSFVWPFFAIYMGRHGSSLSDVSLIISAGGVGGLLGNLFGGWLCDRIGRRHSLFSGAMVNSVILISLYSFPPLALLICLAFLGGAAYGVTRAAYDSLMTDIVPLALRVRSQAVLQISVNFGVGVGMVLGAEVAGHSAFWLFAGAAIATACYGAIALFALPHGATSAKTGGAFGTPG